MVTSPFGNKYFDYVLWGLAFYQEKNIGQEKNRVKEKNGEVWKTIRIGQMNKLFYLQCSLFTHFFISRIFCDSKIHEIKEEKSAEGKGKDGSGDIRNPEILRS